MDANGSRLQVKFFRALATHLSTDATIPSSPIAQLFAGLSDKQVGSVIGRVQAYLTGSGGSGQLALCGGFRFGERDFVNYTAVTVSGGH